MNDSQFLSLAWTQLIQVSVLIAVVWLLVKLFARQRPHLAHALWLLVLVKCLTPPMMSSPTGLLTQIPVPEVPWERFLLRDHPAEEPDVLHAVVEPKPEPQIEHIPEPWEPETDSVVVDDLSRGFVVDESEFPPELLSEEPEPQIADAQPIPVISEETASPLTRTISSTRLWKSWLTSAGILLLLTLVRVLITLRRVYRHRVTVPAELESIVARLSKQLKLRRKVRILVTASKVGPAVVGFFRPILILPQVVTQGRSPQELEPIIAHELLHVKRGDLGIGWLQVLTQSLWWFHPLVWLVNRFLNREAERCCDEAVVAELDCSPAVYARCLLNVLEQKRNLTPIPACPGVKPVDLTKQRMERIMKLGQGCRKRTPWWCWLIVVLLGLVVLPGRGESETDANQATIIFKLNEAHATQVTTEIETEGVEASATDTSKLVTQTYSIENIVQRMCDDHGLTEQTAQIHLELLISNSISSLHVGPLFQGSPTALTKCIVSENSLIVRGTEEGHKLVKGLLKLWEDVGLYQIKIETRFVSTDVQISAENVTGKQEANSALTAKLTDLDAFRLINTMQSDARTNIYMAPKVTLFNGQQAVVQDEVIRPFVTGIEGNKPDIETLPEGWKLKITPTVDAQGNIKLDYQLRLSAILDVDTKDLQGRQGQESATVQIPDARQMHVRSKTTLRDGETLLISGLKRHAQKQDENHAENLLVMITAKLEKVELHDLAGKAMTAPDEVMERFSIDSNSRVTGSIGIGERNDDVQTAPHLRSPVPRHWFASEISVSFEEMPLKRAIKQICEAGNLKVMFFENDKIEFEQFFSTGLPDAVCFENELAEDGISLATPVTYSAENEATFRVLEDMLSSCKLGLQLRLIEVNQQGKHKSVLEIRAQSENIDRDIPITTTYQIGDLLENDKSLLDGPDQGVPILDKIPRQDKLFRAKPKTKVDAAETLIGVIEKSLAWGYAGKPSGTIRFHSPAEALIVHCNRSQHELIAKLLYERRKACGLEIGSYLPDDVQYFPPTPLSPKDGPGPSVMPSLTPSPRESGTVQLRFLGPEKSFLSIRVPDRLNTTYDLLLPGWQDLAPGKKYLLTLENIPGKSIKSDWPVDFVHDPKFHWRLEIPEGNERTNGYLQHNSIPLNFTDKDLAQVATHNSVTKVVYLPHPDTQKLAIGSVETLVSTQLKPDVDPIEEAKKRGTILAVLRSHNGNLMIGTGVENEAGVSGSLILDESQFDDGPQQPHKPDDNNQKPFLTKVYPVADLVVPIPQIDIPKLDIPPAVDWGKPITGTPISIPGPPHLPVGGATKAATYPSPQAGDLALRAQQPAKLPSMNSTPAPNPDAPVTGTPVGLSRPPHMPLSPPTKAKTSEYLFSIGLEGASYPQPVRPACDADPVIELLTKALKAAHDQVIPEAMNLVFVQDSLSLVVRASQPDHEIIAELLSDLRRKQRLQVTLECRVFQMTKEASGDGVFGSITFDSVDATQKFLKYVEGQEGTQIIAAPKLTVFNGAGAQIQLSRVAEDKRDAEKMHFMIVPTVSEDRRKIDVKFAVNPTSSLDALSKAKSMSVRDGQPVLVEVTDELLSSLRGTATLEVDNALRALKKKELGVRTFVLLTPKIIIQEDEEELLELKRENGNVLMKTPQSPLIEEEEKLLGIPEE